MVADTDTHETHAYLRPTWCEKPVQATPVVLRDQVAFHVAPWPSHRSGRRMDGERKVGPPWPPGGDVDGDPRCRRTARAWLV